MRVQKNDLALMMLSGKLEHTALLVKPDDLVRAYVVSVGPGMSGIRMMGTILDMVYDGTSAVRNVQTHGVPPGSGAIVEVRIPEAGMYGLVDHDRLLYLPYGMVIAFSATGGHPTATHWTMMQNDALASHSAAPTRTAYAAPDIHGTV